MDFGFYFLWREDLFDYSLFVYEVCGAQCANGSASACHLLAPAAQGLQQGGLGIGDEWELQALSLCELLLQGLLFLAYTDNLITRSSKFGFVCLQSACLCSASAGVCLWITIEHNLLAFIVTALDFASVLVYAQHLGYSVSDIHNCSVLMVINI